MHLGPVGQAECCVLSQRPGGKTSDMTTPAKKVECPTCGTVATHDDDFCYECGHGFDFRDEDPLQEGEQRSAQCPVCPSGEVVELSYGVRQCDMCGFSERD